MSFVYFILGTPGSGRREIVRDLIENGLGPSDPVLVLLADGEPSDPAEEKLAARAATQVRREKWTPVALPGVKLPAGGSVFLLADVLADPITQIETLKPWLAQHGAELARIITVVDCRLAEQHPALRPWYEACVHFSDVVFLTKREGVANKWLSGFLRHFRDECFPSHFIQLKKDGVPNPALVLEPQPRRVSQYFDPAEDLSGVEIETDDEENAEEDDEDQPPTEPYFERLRNGRRAKELPDLRDYLPARAKP
jgi:hypothetical protein